MSEQITIHLNDIDHTLFLKEGAIVGKFDSDLIWIGYGKNVGRGSIQFFRSNFFNTKYIQYVPEFVVATTKEELLKWPILQNLPTTEYTKALNLDHEFIQDVCKIKSWIHTRSLKKLVAVTRQCYKTKNSLSLLSLIYQALQSLPGTLYGYWNNSRGMLGMTPELLFSKEGSNYRTFALAGTISKDIPSYKKVLLGNEKEIEEHQLVVTDLKKKLTPLSSDLAIKDMQVVDYSQMAHIKTEMSFTLNHPMNHKTFINKLSPSAALGGHPFKLAKHFLKKTNHFNFQALERFFGGNVGIQLPDYEQVLVAIRNIQWQEKNLWIESGSGIVQDSIPQNELSEVQEKRKVVEKALLADSLT